MHQDLTASKVENRNINSDVEYYLKNAVSEANVRLQAIEEQRENLEEHEQDNREPGEGQYPGYNNVVRINRPKTVGNLRNAIENVGVASDEQLWTRKKSLMEEIETLEKAMKGTKRKNNLDGKEKLFEQVLFFAGEIIELSEENKRD